METTHGHRRQPAVLITYKLPSPIGRGSVQYDRELAAVKARLVEIANALREMVGSVETHPYGLDSVAINEFDLILCLGPFPPANVHQISSIHIGARFQSDGPGSAYLEWHGSSLSGEWTVCDSPFSDAARSELGNWARVADREKQLKPGTTRSLVVGAVTDGIGEVPSKLGTPLITSTDKTAVVGMVVPPVGEHTSGVPIHWILPSGADPVTWVGVAVTYLNTFDPVRYPTRTGWKELPRYMTPNELDLHRDRAATQEELQSTTLELQQRIEDLSQKLDHASSIVQSTDRQLVTEKGKVLETAVQRALEELGFTNVTNPDEDYETKGQNKREDLNFRFQDGTVCVVEIKGTRGAAEQAAVSQLDRHVIAYMADHQGPIPARRWLIVNQFRGGQPSDRGQPYKSAAWLIDELRQNQGLVMDTAQLLELLLDVRKGNRKAADVRELLWTTLGRLEEPRLPNASTGP